METDCCEESMPETACDEPMPQPINPNSHYKVIIEKVNNGFIVKIGCATFVSKEWNEIGQGLAEYWKDPRAAEKKFCK